MEHKFPQFNPNNKPETPEVVCILSTGFNTAKQAHIVQQDTEIRVLTLEVNNLQDQNRMLLQRVSFLSMFNVGNRLVRISIRNTSALCYVCKSISICIIKTAENTIFGDEQKKMSSADRTKWKMDIFDRCFHTFRILNILHDPM